MHAALWLGSELDATGTRLQREAHPRGDTSRRDRETNTLEYDLFLSLALVGRRVVHTVGTVGDRQHASDLSCDIQDTRTASRLTRNPCVFLPCTSLSSLHHRRCVAVVVDVCLCVCSRPVACSTSRWVGAGAIGGGIGIGIGIGTLETRIDLAIVSRRRVGSVVCVEC